MVKVYFAKTPSTPEDQSIGVLNGIRALLEELGVAPDCVTGVAHGTTVATNTLLERNGAVTALITTKGFRDVLDIGRQSRPELYDLHARKPASINSPISSSGGRRKNGLYGNCIGAVGYGGIKENDS